MTRDQLLFRLYTGIILLIVLVAICAPLISPYDPYTSQIQNSLLPPSAEHYFGTDKLGRDIFTRILYGARISITMALIVVVISGGMGTLIGVISAYIGGKVDNVIMRLTDVFLAFPGIVLAIAIAGVLGGSAVNAVLAVVIVGWTKYARLARSHSRSSSRTICLQQLPAGHVRLI